MTIKLNRFHRILVWIIGWILIQVVVSLRPSLLFVGCPSSPSKDGRNKKYSLSITSEKRCAYPSSSLLLADRHINSRQHPSLLLSSFPRRSVLVCRSTSTGSEGKEEEENLEDIFDEIFTKATMQLDTYDSEGEGEEISTFYKRDPDDDANRPIGDELDVADMLRQRFYASKGRRFDQVHQIDESLKVKYRIKVYDNPNIWTRQRRPPTAYLQQRERRRIRKMKNLYGPTGHPYRQVGGPVSSHLCPLSPSQLHNLLLRLEDCRSMGRHEEATAILFELSQNSIAVSESKKIWRGDGRMTFPSMPSSSSSSSSSSASQLSDNGHYKGNNNNYHHQKNTGKTLFPKNVFDFTAPPKLTQNYGIFAPEYSKNKNDIDNTNINGNKSRSKLRTPPKRRRRRVQQLLEMRDEAILRGERDVADFLSLELFHTYGAELDHDSNGDVNVRMRDSFYNNSTCVVVENEDNDSGICKNEDGYFDDEFINNWLKSEFNQLGPIEERRRRKHQAPSLPLLLEHEFQDTGDNGRYTRIVGRDDDDDDGTIYTFLAIGSNVSSSATTAGKKKNNVNPSHYPIIPRQVRLRIDYLVNERRHKREERKFIEANALTEELRYTYAVHVDDKRREWTIDYQEWQNRGWLP